LHQIAVDLVIETKKARYYIIRRLLAKALRQVGNQPCHAFQQDYVLVVEGSIIAAGNVWQYGELERGDALAARNANRRDNYTPTPSATAVCATPEAPSTTTSRVTSQNVL
jgi:hypothetical protein